MTICFLRDTGTDPLKKQLDPKASKRRLIQPSVKYVDDLKRRIKKRKEEKRCQDNLMTFSGSAHVWCYSCQGNSSFSLFSLLGLVLYLCFVCFIPFVSYRFGGSWHVVLEFPVRSLFSINAYFRGTKKFVCDQVCINITRGEFDHRWI